MERLKEQHSIDCKCKKCKSCTAIRTLLRNAEKSGQIKIVGTEEDKTKIRKGD